MSTDASVGAIRRRRSISSRIWRAVADDPFEAELLVEPPVELRVRPPQVLAPRGVIHHRPQLLEVERFQQIIEGALPHRLDGRFDRAVAGDQNHFGFGQDFFTLRQELQPADIRHFEVRDDDLERVFFEQLHAVPARVRHGAFVPLPKQTIGDRLGMREIVIDNQHLNRRPRLGGTLCERHGLIMPPRGRFREGFTGKRGIGDPGRRLRCKSP